MGTLKLIQLSRGLPPRAKKICRLGHRCSALVEELKRMKRKGTIEEAPSIILELRDAYSSLEYMYLSIVREKVSIIKKGGEYIEELKSDLKKRRTKMELEIGKLPDIEKREIPWARIVSLSYHADDLISLITDVLEEAKRKWIGEYSPPKEDEIRRIRKHLSERFKVLNEVCKRLIKYPLSRYPTDKDFIKKQIEKVTNWYDAYLGKYLSETQEKALYKKYKYLYQLMDHQEKLFEHQPEPIKESSIKDPILNTAGYINQMDKQLIAFHVERLETLGKTLEEGYSGKEIKYRMLGLSPTLKESFWKVFSAQALLRAGIVPATIIERKIEKAKAEVVPKRPKKKPEGGEEKSKSGEEKKEKATS